MNHSITGIAVKDGNVFVARRSAGGSMGERWEFPGGKVEKGENFEQALIREFDEEFACAITVGEPIDVQYFDHNGESFSLHAYAVSFLENPVAVPAEHTEMKWLPMTEIERLVFVDSDIKLFPAVRLYLDGSPAFQEHSRTLPPKEGFPE